MLAKPQSLSLSLQDVAASMFLLPLPNSDIVSNKLWMFVLSFLSVLVYVGVLEALPNVHTLYQVISNK